MKCAEPEGFSQTANASVLEPRRSASCGVSIFVAKRPARTVPSRCFADVTAPCQSSPNSFILSVSTSETLTLRSTCDFCFGSGFVERIAIYEMLQIDDVVKEQVMDRANATNIKKSAIERGVLRTLRMDGIQKVLQGLTTYKEVKAVAIK